MAFDVDLRSSESGDTTELGDPAGARPKVTDRPSPRERLSAVLALAVVLAAVIERGGRAARSTARTAWPPTKRLAVRALSSARRRAAAAGRSARAATVRGAAWVQHWLPIVARRAVQSARTFGRWVRRRWPDFAAAVTSSVRAALVAVAGAAGAVEARSRRWLAERRARPGGRGGRLPVPLSRVAKVAVSGVAIVAFLVSTVAVGGRAAVSAVASGVTSADPKAVALPALPQRSELFAADGSPLGVVQADHGNRVVVPLDAVPKVVIDAVLATEDADFWDHDGIDMSGVARAAKRNVTAGEVAQGGSTITQQLAKSTLPSPKRDLRRKVTEAVLALRLDDQLGKRGVLERYLNTIYFGHGAYGVAVAAETYFARPLGEVTADQAALLAGLIRGPNLYDPLTRPDAARARRSTVLDQMVHYGHVTPDEAAAAASAPLPTEVHRPAPALGWVADAARAELLADPRLGDTPEVRASSLAGGGLRVHTTVDPGLQREAEAAVSRGVPGGTDLTAALASVEPASGAVRALVGGTDYAGRQFNAATDGAGRQTGSAFKVFTLVAALRAGHVSSETVDGSSPCPIPNPGGKPNPWLPENYEGEAFGELSLVDATVHSSNCAYARLATTVGVEGVSKTAAEMGITAPLQKVPSMTLGTNTVPPLQMAAAYATLAADGVARTPHIVSRVERADGSVVLANDGGPRQVLDPQVARVATAVLSQVVARGTGRAAGLAERPVAGKTGTAQNHQDAWFVGYTPQLATAVWMGDVNGERPMLNIGGINVTGGSYPARIWRQFMASAHAGLPIAAFGAPAPEPPPAVTTPAPIASSPTPSKDGKGKGKGKG